MATTQPTGPGPGLTNTTVGNYSIYGTGPYYWPTVTTTPPSVTRFRGTVQRMEDLSVAENVKTGDAYFVSKPSVLVVRMASGWFTFDGP